MVAMADRSEMPPHATIRVLFVEDDDLDVELLIRELRRGGFEPAGERVDSREAMAAALGRARFDLVISDHRMPRFSAPAALELLKERGLDLPFIIVSAQIDEETAVAAMRAGAHDYVLKGNLARLTPAIRRELSEAAGRLEAARLADRLRQAQKIEAIGQLAGGVAHDFNNNLTIIMSYADAALRRLGADDPLAGDLNEILRAATSSAALTRQLLAFSRRQVLRPVVLDLNVVISDLHRMLARLIGENIEIVTRLEPRLPRVLADRGQLEQVVMNLAVNARDAMPRGGTLTIETGLAEARPGEGPELDPARGRRVALDVADTGAGMDAATLAHLFEPFFTTKEPGKGTGLGLATVYGIVRQSGGSISVDTAPGAGSRFRILLPAHRDEPSAAGDVAPAGSGAGSAPPAPLRSGTVLLVEDDAAVRVLVREVLARSGYRVLVARGAEEALALAARHRSEIDLVLSDIVMPRMSGPDLVGRLREQRAAPRVLFMSGYSDGAGVRPLEAAVLEKPFTPGGLLHAVREAFDLAPRAAAEGAP
jgi:signal transduction histidine kinase